MLNEKECVIAPKEIKKGEKEGEDDQIKEEPEVAAILSDEESGFELVIDEAGVGTSRGTPGKGPTA